MKSLHIIAMLSFVTLTSCTRADDEPTKKTNSPNILDSRLKTTDERSIWTRDSVYIVTDTKTNREYLVVNSGHGVAIIEIKPKEN